MIQIVEEKYQSLINEAVLQKKIHIINEASQNLANKNLSAFQPNILYKKYIRYQLI